MGSQSGQGARNTMEENTINLQPQDGGGFEGLSSISIGDLISGLISLALLVAAVIFFFMLVIGGIRWILSGGDKGQTEAARGQITAALIGLVIVFAAWAIGNIIGAFFGVEIFNFTIPTLGAGS